MMKQDVLEVLKIKEIFTLPHHGLQAFTIFLKLFPWILSFDGGFSFSLIKIKKVNNL